MLSELTNARLLMPRCSSSKMTVQTMGTLSTDVRGSPAEHEHQKQESIVCHVALRHGNAVVHVGN